MEADLHRINGETRDKAEAEFDAQIDAKAQIAFACDCRLAVERWACTNGCCIRYNFTVLSAGEIAPKGWTIYENHGGRAVGRSA